MSTFKKWSILRIVRSHGLWRVQKLDQGDDNGHSNTNWNENLSHDGSVILNTLNMVEGGTTNTQSQHSDQWRDG